MNKFFYRLLTKEYWALLAAVAMITSMAIIFAILKQFTALSSIIVGMFASLSGAVVAYTVASSMRRLRNRASAFISYTHQDEKFVEMLVNTLTSVNVEPIIDRLQLKVGENIRTAVDEMIDRSDYFVFVVSKNSMQSDWAKEELKQALNRKKKVLPVVLDIEALPEELSGVFYADFSVDYDRGAAQLKNTFL